MALVTGGVGDFPVKFGAVFNPLPLEQMFNGFIRISLRFYLDDEPSGKTIAGGLTGSRINLERESLTVMLLCREFSHHRVGV